MTDDQPAADQPPLSITYDERGLCLWIPFAALAASKIVTNGPNGPAAPFAIDIDTAHTLLTCLHTAIDDRDLFITRDTPDDRGPKRGPKRGA